MKRVKFEKLCFEEIVVYEFLCPCCRVHVRSEENLEDYMNEKGTKEDDAEIFECPECGDEFMVMED